MAHPAYTGPTSEGVRVTGQTFLGRLQLQYGLRGLAPFCPPDVGLPPNFRNMMEQFQLIILS